MNLFADAAAKQPKTPDLIAPVIRGLYHGVLAVWPLWLLIGAAALGKLALQLYRLRRLAKSGIADIDEMDGHTFEVFLSTLFRRLGYGVEVTRYRGDYGADLVITRAGRKTAVQAKRWSKRVGAKAVQEAVAAKGFYSCDAALVVANREFTQPARKLASANGVELWDREALVAKLLVAGNDEPAVEGVGQMTLRPARTSEPAKAGVTAPPAAPVGDDSDADTPGSPIASCVQCGSAVSEKARDYCLAHPTRFGGKIYCFKHQRSRRPALAD